MIETKTYQKIMGVWCNECNALRGPSGEWLDWGGVPNLWRPRCGVDYGPDLHSHLDVVQLVAQESDE